jgi:hypothetical protein
MRKLLLMFLMTLSLCGNAFNTEIKIGYDTNYFVPLNPKVDSTDWVKKYAAFNESLLIKGDSIDSEKVVNNKAKDDEDEYSEIVFRALFASLTICFLFFAIIFLTITIIGWISLLIAKLIVYIRKKKGV